MKLKIFCAFLPLLIAVTLNAQHQNPPISSLTYEDGLKAGIESANSWKVAMAHAYPQAATVYVPKEKVIDPLKVGMLGQTYVDQATTPAPYGTATVYAIETNTEGFLGFAWGEIQPFYIPEIFDRRFENDYHAGVFDGFYAHWWLYDFEGI